MLYNSDLRHDLEFDCNYQALLDQVVKPLIDFNAFQHYIQFINMKVILVTHARCIFIVCNSRLVCATSFFAPIW